MPKSSNSGIYRFQSENLPNGVYSPTTLGNKNNKKRSTCCLTSVASVLFMLALMSCFSVIYITDNNIAYYENAERDTILQPGVYLHFIWSSEKLKITSTRDSFLIPTLGDFNITVDYTVINVESFVKSLQKNDKNCVFEIINFIQQKIAETLCMHTVLHGRVYEITSLVNTTVNECGVIITNATSPKNVYKSTGCQPVASV